jgi:hypothetical protein
LLCDVTSREGLSMSARFNAASTKTDTGGVLETRAFSHLDSRSKPHFVQLRSCVIPPAGCTRKG